MSGSTLERSYYSANLSRRSGRPYQRAPCRPHHVPPAHVQPLPPLSQQSGLGRTGAATWLSRGSEGPSLNRCVRPSCTETPNFSVSCLICLSRGEGCSLAARSLCPFRCCVVSTPSSRPLANIPLKMQRPRLNLAS